MYAVPSLLACLFLQPAFIARFIRPTLKNHLWEAYTIYAHYGTIKHFYIKVIMVFIVCGDGARDPGVWICSLTSELFNEISHVGSETVGKGRWRAWKCRPNVHHELELRRTASWRGCNQLVFLRSAASLAIYIYIGTTCWKMWKPFF